MKTSYLMLTLLIPGRSAPGKDMDVFLQPLIDELKELWETGVVLRDGSTGELFRLFSVLLWTVNDFPARSSLSGWSGQGYLACPTCNNDTPSQGSKQDCLLRSSSILAIVTPDEEEQTVQGTK